MRILLIHGRAQGGKDPDALKDTWVATLQQGLAAAQIPASRLNNVAIDFPFYGDDLDHFTAMDDIKASPPTAKGIDTDTEFDRFYREVLTELANHNAIPESDVDEEMPDASATEKGFANWEWVHAVARVIDRHLTGISKFSIELFLRDVYLYVQSDIVREAINQKVIEMLTDEPTIVVGHSLGSVVGYDVIMKHRSSRNFLKYVTVGSPLGIEAISKHLGVIDNPVPHQWFNAYDEGDVVALNPLNDKYFDVTPAIVNFDGVHNHTDNQHGIIGYLNDPRVAHQIVDLLS